MCEAVEEALSFHQLELLQRFVWSVSFTLEQTRLFCQVSGDNNPIHTDPEFAKRHGIPGGTVVHGAHLIAEVSRACGNELFVPGVVGKVLGETDFRRWVYHGVPHEFELEVRELIPGKRNQVVFNFRITTSVNGLSKICVVGSVRLTFP